MMPKTLGLFLVTLVSIDHCAVPVQGARILAALPFFASSHHRFSQSLLKALARAGHEVVVYSPFPLQHPVQNYTDFFMDNVSTENDNITHLVLQLTKAPHYECLDLFFDLWEIIYDDFMKSDKVQSLLKSSEHFDLVITEAFNAQEFTLMLGHIFKAPVIALQAIMTNNAVNSDFGNSLSLSHIPDLCTPFSNRMTYVERFLNSLYSLRNLYYVRYYKYLPVLDKRIRADFPGAPPLWDMINNISLIFVNDHLTADYPQPRPANIVPVAGIHIENEQPLSKTLQQFMDNASEGVILFSLGTYVRDELQPQEYFDMYCRVFRQLRQRVLWKTREGNIHGLPENVMTIKWAPQRGILAHPKCVLFVTHGGLNSQHETVHYGVPVVTIAQFYDQHRNTMYYQENGVGVRLDNRNLTEHNVLSAIHTVLEDPKYSSNMKRLSRVFRDRPLTPAETVVFWTEYVVRHGGSHLRPASTRLSWYQLALLDVLTVILAVIVSLAFVVYFAVWSVWKYIHRLREATVSKSKKYS